MTPALFGGLGLTGLVTGMVTWAWGRDAVLAGLTFGLLATAIQVASAALVRPAAKGDFTKLIRRWGIGMALRVAGIAVFGVAAWLDPVRFPPLASAAAYLGVLIPLLFWETRFLR